MFKRKIMVFIALVLAFCMLLSACGAYETSLPDNFHIVAATTPEPVLTPEPKHTPEPDPTSQYTPMGEPGTWSIFLYLCGTDLETVNGAATQNLEELLSLSYTDNVNVIVQTGGTKKWQTQGIPNDKLARFVIKDGAVNLLDEQPIANMGDAQTLTEFLSWGIENYPAEKMAPVFWNHGGGSITGVCFDELYDNNSLVLSELAQAFDAVSENMTDKFEFVGFDTCLMATLENAAMLAPYSRYMVASEELEPGGGWQYDSWVGYIINNPGAGGKEVGKIICDSFFAKCKSSDDSDMATLSVTDLGAIEPLLIAFESVAKDMVLGIDNPKNFSSIIKGSRNAESYGGNTPEEGYTNMVDLGDLVSKIKDVLPNTSSNLLKTLANAVVYQIKGAKRAYANGLSLYFPLVSNEEEAKAYQDFSVSKNYSDFIRKTALGVTQAQASQEETIVIEKEAQTNSEGYYEMKISADSVNNVEDVLFTLAYYSDDKTKAIVLGSDNDLDVNWDTGVVKDNFRGVWPSLYSQPVSLNLIESTDGYNIYSIPIKLNGKETNLRVSWVWDNNADGHFEILGAWDGIDSQTGMSSREIIKLAEGDKVLPIYVMINLESGESEKVFGDEITITDTPEIKEEALEAGQYLFFFEVKDIYGGSVYSKETTINLDANGDITIE